MAATPAQKRKARLLWEQERLSMPVIAKKLGFSANTIAKWKKADGDWSRDDSDLTPVFDSSPADITYAVASSADADFVLAEPDVSAQEKDERDFRIAELEAEVARQQAEIERIKPSVDVSRMLEDTVEYLTELLGEDYWENLAQRAWQNENRQRAKDNLPPVDVKEHDAWRIQHIADLKAKVAARHEGAPIVFSDDARPSRKIKLIIDRKQADGKMLPTIEQIPYEGHINNVNGSLADGLVRYTQKGFRITDPLLCFAQDCFKPAAVIGDRYLYDCYCSEYHRSVVEGGNKPKFDTSIASTTAAGAYVR